LTFAYWLAALAAVTPIVASAQGIIGSGGGTLSERASYSALYRGHPDSAAIELIVILRGTPGWNLRGGHARESMGPISASGRVPIWHRLTIGSTTIEYSYQSDGRILRVGDAEYPLGSHNAVVLNNVDSVGGPVSIVRLTLALPSAVSRHSLSDTLRSRPELQEFIR